MYVFYGYVKTVKAASEELHKLSSGAQLNAAHMELGEEVRMLNAIEAAVAAVPKLATEE